VAGHHCGVRPHSEGFPEINGHEKGKDATKICLGFAAGCCFQKEDKKENPFGEHHAAGSWEGNLRELSTLCCLSLPPQSKQPCCSQVQL